MGHRLKVTNPIVKLAKMLYVTFHVSDPLYRTFIVIEMGMMELRNLIGIMTRLMSLTRNLRTR